MNVYVPMKIPSEDNLDNPLYVVPYYMLQIRQEKLSCVGSTPLIGYKVIHDLWVPMTNAGMRDYALT